MREGSIRQLYVPVLPSTVFLCASFNYNLDHEKSNSLRLNWATTRMQHNPLLKSQEGIEKKEVQKICRRKRNSDLVRPQQVAWALALVAPRETKSLAILVLLLVDFVHPESRRCCSSNAFEGSWRHPQILHSTFAFIHLELRRSVALHKRKCWNLLGTQAIELLTLSWTMRADSWFSHSDWSTWNKNCRTAWKLFSYFEMLRTRHSWLMWLWNVSSTQHAKGIVSLLQTAQWLSPRDFGLRRYPSKVYQKWTELLSLGKNCLAKNQKVIHKRAKAVLEGAWTCKNERSAESAESAVTKSCNLGIEHMATTESYSAAKFLEE